MIIKSGGRSVKETAKALGNAVGNTAIAGAETGKEVAETARNTAHTVKNVVHTANKAVIAVGQAAKTTGQAAQTVGQAVETTGNVAQTTGQAVEKVVGSAGNLAKKGLDTLGHAVSTEKRQARQKGERESAEKIGQIRGQRKLANEKFKLQKEELQKTQKIRDLQRKQEEAQRKLNKKKHERNVRNEIESQKQSNNSKRREGKRKVSSKQENFLDESASVYVTMINELLNSNQFKNGKISSVDVKLKSKENRKKLWEYATKGKKQSGMILKKDVESELLKLIGDNDTEQETKKLFLNLLVRKIEQFLLNQPTNVQRINNDPISVANLESSIENSGGGMRKYKTKKRKHKKTKKNKRKKSKNTIKAKKIMKSRKSIKIKKYRK